MANRSRLISAGSRVRLRLATDERLVALVRRGDASAFEVLYDRHAAELLSFGAYMLGSRQDAEDAVQLTYTSAYRALVGDSRPVVLRAWLFTIARNECLSILRRRRPSVELNGEVALTGDPVRHVEVHEELRHVLEGVRKLPEGQRSALVLAEVHGLSQAEIGEVLGVRAKQVKAYIYQARSNLISERRAREVDCREIREELATARGAALLQGRLRRHVRVCAGCRAYADGVSRQHRQLGALLPLAPSLMLKYRVLEEVLGICSADPATYAGGAAIGASMAGTAAEVAGGGMKALAVKVVAGVAALGASAGMGVSVLNAPATHGGSGASTGAVSTPLLASVGGTGASGSSASSPAGSQPRSAGARTGGRAQGRRGSGPRAHLGVPTGQSGKSAQPPEGGPADGGEPQAVGAPPREAETRGGERAQRGSKGGASPRESEQERARERSQLQRKREERAQQREEHRRLRLERQGGRPSSPGGEEGAGKHREHQPGGASGAPKSEEELQHRREEAKRKREERRKRREEEKHAGK